MRRLANTLLLGSTLLLLAPPSTATVGEGAQVPARQTAEAGDVPFRQGPALTRTLLLRVVGTTAGALVLIWAGATLFRRRFLGAASRDSNTRRIRVLETQRLSARTTLVLVRVGRREVLLGQSGENLVVLHEEAEESTGGTRAQA